MTAERAALAATTGFALWTLCANAAYALQLPLLAAAALFCFGAAGVLAIVLLRGSVPSPLWGEGRGEGRRRVASRSHKDSAPHPSPLHRGEGGSGHAAFEARIPVLFAAVLTLIAWRATGQFAALWAGATIVGVAGVWANARRGGEISDADARRGEWVVWAFAVLAAVLALGVRSFSADDAYYLNRAAQLAENVWSVMPHHYGLFGDERPVPFPYPTFPLTAYHDLIGLSSAVTWLQPLQLSSIVCVPVAAALVPVAYAILLRRLLPASIWPWALAVAMALLLLEGTGERFVSQFGLPRVWQGKSILLHVGLPIVLAWAIDLGRSGRAVDGLRVSAALVALVGLNSMGIWIGPATAAMGVAVGWWGRNGSLRDAAQGGAVAAAMLGVACWYPALLAWLFVGGSEAAVGYRFAPPDLPATLLAAFGSERVMTVWLALVLVAPAVAPTATARLLGAVMLAATFGFALNPWLASYVSGHVTSGVLYWRVLWLLPIVPIAASVICAGLAAPRHWGAAELLPGIPMRHAAAAAGVAGVLILYGGLVPERWVISRGNRVGLGLPGVKAPAGPWGVARRLRRELPPDATVLAPTSVSWLLVTMTDAPDPVVPRPIAVEHAFARQLGDSEEARRRLEAANYLGGQKDLDAVHLWDAVRRYRVSALVLRPLGGPPEPPETAGVAGSPGPAESTPREPLARPHNEAAETSDMAERERLRGLLSAGGFVRSDVAGFEVWLRQGLGADER